MTDFAAARKKMVENQLQTSGIKEVRIRYVGELAGKNTDPLKVALLKGLLQPTLRETVNYVNAQLLASDRGIRITETKSATASDFNNLISLEVHCDNEVRQVGGTILGESEERIVSENLLANDPLVDGGFIGEYEAFFRTLAEGTPSPCSLSDAARSMQLAEAVLNRYSGVLPPLPLA